MKRKSSRRQFEFLSNFSRRDSDFAMSGKQPENPQSRFVSQSCKSSNGLNVFHILTILEISNSEPDCLLMEV